jgi:probable phosphoglycerate mutase
MTIIGLVRHGITDWNLEGKVQGHSDIPLNEEGRKQAQLLSQRMKGESWDFIYCSDLGRASETAQLIGEIKGVDVIMDKRLREVHCGLIEGTTEAERVKKWGYGWSKLDLGMESQQDVMARGVAFINDIVERHPDQRILVVSHFGLLGHTLKKLIPHEDIGEHLDNTSVTILKKGEHRWECELFNCTKHLDGGVNDE